MSSLFDTASFNERLFFPRADRSAAPASAEDHFVDVPGARLHVRWHRRLRPAAPTLLLFHGNGETVRDYDASAPRFAGAGLNLAVMDYRGYGQSTGTPTLRTMLSDALLVIRAVRMLVAEKLVVMGRSLGSACMSECCANDEGAADAFVLESGFVDLKALITRRGRLPPATIAPLDAASFDPLPKLQRDTRPLLVLHGAADEVIDAAEARVAFEAAGSPRKKLVLVPGHGHNDVSHAAIYWDALAELARSMA